MPLASPDHLTIVQQRHIIETCAVLHGRLEPEAALHAHKAIPADIDRPYVKHAVFDAVAEQVSFGADAGSFADRNDVEGHAYGRRYRNILADFCAHRPVI